jgi:hypothetical protein
MIKIKKEVLLTAIKIIKSANKNTLGSFSANLHKLRLIHLYFVPQASII